MKTLRCNMGMWNPWRGCHKISEGCKNCYIHKGDAKRNIDTNNIIKTADFNKPVQKLKNGNFKLKSGLCYLCFSTDFLLPEADEWRIECWQMIKERTDVNFLFLTKRIDRFLQCIPEDWGDGYDNVTVGCTIENQEMADYRLEIFKNLPIKHKNIICQPLLENINIEQYLSGVELVVVGGESDYNARSFSFDWVLNLHKQCEITNVSFEFRQFGTKTIRDGKTYCLKTYELMRLAREEKF